MQKELSVGQFFFSFTFGERSAGEKRFPLYFL